MICLNNFNPTNKMEYYLKDLASVICKRPLEDVFILRFKDKNITLDSAFDFNNIRIFVELHQSVLDTFDKNNNKYLRVVITMNTIESTIVSRNIEIVFYLYESDWDDKKQEQFKQLLKQYITLAKNTEDFIKQINK